MLVDIKVIVKHCIEQIVRMYLKKEGKLKKWININFDVTRELIKVDL